MIFVDYPAPAGDPAYPVFFPVDTGKLCDYKVSDYER